jgi:3'(2'), 5'-bisphosphate nucleotidase
MTAHKLEEITQFLKTICREAGDRIMRFYNDDSLWQTQTKADNTVLTEADLAANQCLMEAIQQTYPDIYFMSEEIEVPEFDTRSSYQYYFLADPLDGTKSFVKKTGEFSVNVALIHRDTVIAGCVYFPVLDAMYYAHAQSQAFRQSSATAQPEPIFAANFHTNMPNLNVVCSHSHHNPATQEYIDQLQTPKARHVGASLKFMEVAEGSAHIYPRFGSGMKEWDVAASQIIVERAGGTVIDPLTQQPMRYNKPDMLVPNFIASGNIIA